jgi:DNA-directed RNA polymerase specialized sigma24 family protein
VSSEITAGAPGRPAPERSGPSSDTGADCGDELLLPPQGQELSRIEDLLAQGVGPEAAEARAARLAGDARVVEVLRADGFTGPRYRKFAGQLMEYGWPIMIGWNSTGEIFRQTSMIHRPVPAGAIVHDWDRDDRSEVATETVLAGLELFRTHALENGRWAPQGGATLTTYYVGACVRAFRPVYIRWSRERMTRQAMRVVPLGPDEADPLASIPDQRAADPYRAAAVHDELSRILPLLTDPKLRIGVAWRAVGCSQSEAATLAGLTEKALERRLSRVRVKLRTTAQRWQEPGKGVTR